MNEERLTTLIDAQRLARRIAALGQAISRDYQGLDLTVIGILKGSFLFMADLVRQVDLPLHCDFLELSSYGDGMSSSGVVRINKDLTHAIQGRHCLVVEDIVDTGLTLRYLRENLATREPSSVRVCALLDKPAGRRTDVAVDYIGFEIPDAFVVGYGLDLAQTYRNLPYVAVYHPDGVPAGGHTATAAAIREPALAAHRPS